MAIFKINKTSDYTVMSNSHLKEKEMSLKAKGLLTLMLSLPDTWDYSIKGLCAICSENETAIKAALKELKTFGYLTITKKLPNETTSGRIEYDYNIFEFPQKQEGKKQGLEKQGLENLPLVFPRHNIEELNTKEKKEKENNIYKYILKEREKISTEIVDYLNEKTKAKYSAQNKKTKMLIYNLLDEGFTLEDFKKVIDTKANEWLNTDYEPFLRPLTLFSDKFESYLNQKKKSPARAKLRHFESEREYTKDELAELLDEIENIKF